MKVRGKSKGNGRRQIARPSTAQTFSVVMKALKAISTSRETAITDPILKQVSQCPEAFEVGEQLGKVFDTAKYDMPQARPQDRLMPPPGVIMPVW